MHLLVDGSIPNQFLCVRYDHLVKLAREFQDRDRVSLAHGLMPRDWLLVSELTECAKTGMWESHGFSESASSNVLVASDGSGGSRDTTKCLRQVAFEVATFSLQILSGSSFELERIGFLGRPGARQADLRAELWGAIQAPSCVDETPTSSV